MLYQGKITDWHDDKGYGFVTQNGGGHKAFVHISSFQGRSRRPAIGDIIVYELGEDERKRPRALGVTFAKVTRPQAPSGRESKSASLVRASVGVIVFSVLLGCGVLAGRLPFSILGIYLVMSVVTLFAYGLDKSAAMNNRYRTSEQTLHVLAFACGWPGALFAQAAFRHKSSKREFQFVFWFVVILNLIALTWLASDSGNELWRSLI